MKLPANALPTWLNVAEVGKGILGIAVDCGTVSAGVVESLNYNAKLTMKKAYGFRTARGVKIALYHRLGALPEPEFAHRFW
jgi:hypothetical protein